MQIANGQVARFHYSLSDADGSAIESSRDREPLVVLVGTGGIIPGLESAMIGRSAGDTFSVTVKPEDAYGERDPNLTQRVPKKYLRDADRLKPGMPTMVQTQQGPRMATVVKMGMSVVDLDMNHPMAGKTLTFDIEIIDVRDATEEETAHGHAHGPGGAQH